MRLLQSLCNWLSETRPPPPEAVAVYALTGTETSENWMKPFQMVRDAMGTNSLPGHDGPGCEPSVEESMEGRPVRSRLKGRAVPRRAPREHTNIRRGRRAGKKMGCLRQETGPPRE